MGAVKTMPCYGSLKRFSGALKVLGCIYSIFVCVCRNRRGVAQEREARRVRHGSHAGVRAEAAPVHRTAQHKVVPGQQEDLRLQRRGRDDPIER